MKEELPKFENRKKELQELAGCWQSNYTEALKNVIDKKDAKLDDIADVIWEKGILDHVVPADEKVKAARKELERFILDLGRDDPKLYWRILYGAASVEEAHKKGFSVVPDRITSSVILQAVYSLNTEHYKKYSLNYEKDNIYFILTNKIIEKAKAELEKRGVKPYLIPWDSEGIFHGIPVIVERYTDGQVWLQAKDFEGHKKLFEFTKGGPVFPSELNPEDFLFPNKK